MGEVTGFLKYQRELPARRPVPVRLRDWKEVYEPFPAEAAAHQGARCMDCGIPFCHEGCPLGNLIPEWNDLVYRDDWAEAIERLHATNNFPEFTGRLCPAPCEGACVLGINDDPVTIERIEYEIVERAWSEGWVEPVRPGAPTGKRVAVVGSGPAGLAAAQQLVRAGHEVVVYERAERPGGLLRYGIPEFKMEKAVLDRRLDQLEAEGVEFRCGVSVGAPSPDVPRAAADDVDGPADGRPGGRVRRRGPGRRGDPAPRPARPGSPARRDPPGHGLPEAVQHGPGGVAGRTAGDGRGQARGDHRRRRHRGRLPGHRPPPGGAAACTSSRSCPSPRTTGRPTTRGPPGRSSSARRPRWRRVASACSRSPPTSSSTTDRARWPGCGATRSS